MSSPEIAMPKLRSEAFMSPFKTNARQRLAAATQQGPRTPGVSVQTPGSSRKTRDVFASAGKGKALDKDEIDWEDDDEEDLYAGMSPPKTIQFALPPSKLLQTPGKLACHTSHTRTPTLVIQARVPFYGSFKLTTSA